MPVDFDPTRPIYHQIIETVKYRAGAKLPSVREMAREMGANPNTMARAYMELEREGFVTTHRGEGPSSPRIHGASTKSATGWRRRSGTGLSRRSANWRWCRLKSTSCCEIS